MVLKVIRKNGSIQYYAGKDKNGRIILTDRKKAKEFSPRAKGAMNQIIYQIEKEQNASCEYTE